VRAARAVVARHRAYLEEGHDLAWLAAELAPLRERIEALLGTGSRSRHQRTANFCAGLLSEYEALWTFCEAPGIDPTNNAAERALRHAVIMRKTQHGTQSERGSRWIERICSVRETCRLQQRSPLNYLTDAAIAAHHRRPLPPERLHPRRGDGDLERGRGGPDGERGGEARGLRTVGSPDGKLASQRRWPIGGHKVPTVQSPRPSPSWLRASQILRRRR